MSSYMVWQAVWHHSGHYRPTEENFHEFMGFLKENNVNLTDVKVSGSTNYNKPFFSILNSNIYIKNQNTNGCLVCCIITENLY